jgi:sugar phosphate isomerase/epimerase
MGNSRRSFFKNAGAGMLTLGLSSAFPSGNLFAQDKKIMNNNVKEDLFKIGIACWTFVKFKIAPSLEMVNRVGVNYICIKDFHLPVNSTAEEIAEFLGKLKAKGITGYGVGPISMRSEAEVNKAFDYAKRVGVKLIVGVPEPELLPYVDKKVKEYDFHYAIHNHGIGDKNYPTVQSIYDKVKNLDSRIGICHDIGYSAQMGFDPAAVTLKYGNRIYDMHIKDLVEKGSADGNDCEIGRGIINFASLVKALRKTKYSGSCSIEMEKDNTDPLPGLAESVGYFKGVLASV